MSCLNGNEIKCIDGARGIINDRHPIIAVDIHLTGEDMLQIPQYIHDNFPFYDLYIRQHSMMDDRTILYAVDPDNKLPVSKVKHYDN